MLTRNAGENRTDQRKPSEPLTGFILLDKSNLKPVGDDRDRAFALVGGLIQIGQFEILAYFNQEKKWIIKIY